MQAACTESAAAQVGMNVKYRNLGQRLVQIVYQTHWFSVTVVCRDSGSNRSDINAVSSLRFGAPVCPRPHHQTLARLHRRREIRPRNQSCQPPRPRRQA